MKKISSSHSMIRAAIIACLLPVFSPAQTFTNLYTATTNPSTGSDVALAVTADATAIYVAGYDLTNGTDYQWRIEKRDLATGGLIGGFGTGGVVTSNPSTGTDNATAITVDATGIYIAGQDGNGGYEWYMEKRNLTTGALIWSKTSNPSAGDDGATAIAVDGSGVYIAGFDDILVGTNYQWRIEKRDLTTGNLIGGFGTGGVITSNVSTSYDYAYGMTIDASGIYVAGVDYNPNYEWRIEKRDLTTGAIIWTQYSNPTTGSDKAWAIAADATAIYIAGYDFVVGTDWEWRIEKRDLTTGNLIGGFGTGGVVKSNPSGALDNAVGITVNAAGIFVAGYDNIPTNNEWRVEKRDLTTGALLCNVTVNPALADADRTTGITSDGTGIYVVGYDDSQSSFDAQWRIEKYDLCGTLPVKLLSFDGRNEERDIRLLWTTATEQNNDYFSVERSSDGQIFEEIGTKKGAGNSTVEKTYSFTDEHPFSGINYYRLKQVDYDGNFTYSKIISITTGDKRQTITIYPVPSDKELNCEFYSDENAMVNIAVTDVLGNTILRKDLKSKHGMNKENLDISNLSQGVYFLRIDNGIQQSQIKFIRQ